MTMPTPDDQISLSEIVRTMKDFREEVRASFGMMIRADVYRAEQATLRAEFAAENATLRQKISELEGRILAFETEKQRKSVVIYSALVSSIAAVIMTFFSLKD